MSSEHTATEGYSHDPNTMSSEDLLDHIRYHHESVPYFEHRLALQDHAVSPIEQQV